jgi:hypothetical protein
MDKSKLNFLIFLIDALMFLVMTALASLGLLIKYVLIPGREAWAKWGRQMEITWLGLDRHAWVEVLPYLAFLLLGLFILRVILHKKTIRALLARFISQPVSRLGVACVFLVVAMTLLALPLLVTPEANEVGVRGDLGLEAPFPGIEEGFPLSAATPGALERERHLDPAGQAVTEVEWTKASPQVKVARKKGHTYHWSMLPQYQTIYPLNLPEDNVLARSQKRTSNLLACCQPPRRRSP